jgi:hypothetical protein
MGFVVGKLLGNLQKTRDTTGFHTRITKNTAAGDAKFRLLSIRAKRGLGGIYF